MNRRAGLIASAIVLILVSFLPLLLGIGTLGASAFVAHVPQTSQPVTQPGWIRSILITEGVVFVTAALWGWITAVGLFRLRRWARVSVLVLAGGQAFFSLIFLLISVLMSFISLPATTNETAEQAATSHSIQHAVAAGFAGFSVVLLGIGLWWLIYFTRKSVREVFPVGTGEVAPSRRPLLIAVLAVLNGVGAFSLLFAAFLPVPTFLFGIILQGWGKSLALLLYTVAIAASAYGLWTLREWGRRLTIVLQTLGIVQSLFLVTQSRAFLRYRDQLNQSIGLTQPQPDLGHLQPLYWGIASFSILFLAAVLFVLHRYRAAFKPEAATPSTSELTAQ